MRLLIVDDSAVIRSIIKSIFEEEQDFDIVGEATNGARAVEMVKELDPELVLMDIDMPIMNGLDATERIMQEHPLPVCIFSNDVDSDLTVRALGCGALDAVRKPDLDKMNDPKFLSDFFTLLRGLSTARPKGNLPSGSSSRVTAGRSRGYSALVIGASTGGPIALKELLRQIPSDFPLGMALVQHIEERFDKSFAQWLDAETALTVRLAENGDRFIPGTLLIAPGGTHLVCREGKLFLDDGPKVINQKPAVDRLFETSAAWFKKSLIAVLLTGMGTDGALGALQVKTNGGHTVIQDEASSAVFGMPKAAIDKNAADIILPLGEIASYLQKLTSAIPGK